MSEILFSFDNLYGIQVKQFQLMLRGKMGWITVEQRNKGLVIVHLNSDTLDCGHPRTAARMLWETGDFLCEVCGSKVT